MGSRMHQYQSLKRNLSRKSFLTIYTCSGESHGLHKNPLCNFNVCWICDSGRGRLHRGVKVDCFLCWLDTNQPEKTQHEMVADVLFSLLLLRLRLSLRSKSRAQRREQTLKLMSIQDIFNFSFETVDDLRPFPSFVRRTVFRAWPSCRRECSSTSLTST